MTADYKALQHVVRAVAVLEALKGLVAVLAAAGLLSLLHSDLHLAAARLVEHAHLNPASKYPRIFIDAAAQLHDSRLLLLALGAAGYSLVRFVEAYGLFRERSWAQWLAAGSGAIYIPMEVFELLRGPNWLGAALLLLNLAIVAAMMRALLHRRAALTAGSHQP